MAAIRYTRDYLTFFGDAIASAADAAALKETLVERYPSSGMLIAADIGSKVAKGEMQWG